jgi:hypothetical protein
LQKTKTRNENEPPRFCCFIPHQRTDGRTGNSLINASWKQRDDNEKPMAS